MEVRIKHIHKQDWSGVTRYPNCFDALGPYFTRSGRIYTGLSAEQAERLGDALGFDLSTGSDFWDTFRIRIGDSDLVLDTDDPYDELRYLFLKDHKRVAKGLDDIKPTANYYISNPEEEAEKKNKYNRIKRKAFKEFDKMTPKEVRKALRLYGFKSDNLSDEVAENRLTTLIEQNPKRFFAKWIDNKHRMTEFLIREAVAKGVIRKNKNIYTYGTTTLGRNLEEAIDYIDNKENSEVKATIINETENK